MTNSEDVTQPESDTLNLPEDVFTRRFVTLLIKQVERDIEQFKRIETETVRSKT